MKSIAGVFLLGLLTLGKGQNTLPGNAIHESTSTCFGVYASDDTNMNATCPAGQVIAFVETIVGIQPAADNCNSTEIQTDQRFDECCGALESDFCSFKSPFTLEAPYISDCNGRQLCNKAAPQILHFEYCGTNGTYPINANNYAHLKFHCIDNSEILRGCSNSIASNSDGERRYLYATASSSCTCAVETDDCTSGITTYTIQRFLKDSTSNCSQNLYIRLSDGSVYNNGNWTCSDNTGTISSMTVPDSYFTITLSSTAPTSGGSFWFGFEASTGNISIRCDDISRQFCDLSSSISPTSSSTLDSTLTPSSTVDLTSSSSEIDLTSSMSSSEFESVTTMSSTPEMTSTEAMTSSSISSTESVSPTSISVTSTSDITPSATASQATNEPSTVDKSNGWMLPVIIVLAVLMVIAIAAIVVLAICLARTCKRVGDGKTSDPEHVSPLPTVHHAISSKSSRPPAVVITPPKEHKNVSTETEPEPIPQTTSPRPKQADIAVQTSPEQGPNLPSTNTVATSTDDRTYVDTGVSPIEFDEPKPATKPRVTNTQTMTDVKKTKSRSVMTVSPKLKNASVSPIKWKESGNGNKVHPVPVDTADNECQVNLLPVEKPVVKTRSRRTQTPNRQTKVPEIMDENPAEEPFTGSESSHAQSAPDMMSRSPASDSIGLEAFSDHENVNKAFHLGSRPFTSRRQKSHRHSRSPPKKETAVAKGTWSKTERGITFTSTSSNGWVGSNDDSAINGHLPNGTATDVKTEITGEQRNRKIRRRLTDGFTDDIRAEHKYYKAVKKMTSSRPYRRHSRKHTTE